MISSRTRRGAAPTARSRRLARRRGATWTLLVIVVSTTLLAAASMYVRTSTQPLELAAIQSREAALREAAFAGVRWAALDAGQRAAGAEGRTTLNLAWGTVSVQFRPVTPGSADVAVTSLATPARGGGSLRVSGVLVRRDGQLVLDTFTTG